MRAKTDLWDGRGLKAIEKGGGEPPSQMPRVTLVDVALPRLSRSLRYKRKPLWFKAGAWLTGVD